MVGSGALSLRMCDEHLHEEPSLRIVLEAKVMRRLVQVLPLNSGGQWLKPSREFGGSIGTRPSSGGRSPDDAQRLSLRHKASAAVFRLFRGPVFSMPVLEDGWNRRAAPAHA